MEEPLGFNPLKGFGEQWRGEGTTSRLGLVAVMVAMALAIVFGGLFAMVYLHNSGNSTEKWAILILAVGVVVLIGLGTALIAQGHKAVGITQPDNRTDRPLPDPARLKRFKQLLVVASAGLVVVWLLAWVGAWHGTDRPVAVLIGLGGTVVLVVLLMTVRGLQRKSQDNDI